MFGRQQASRTAAEAAGAADAKLKKHFATSKPPHKRCKAIVKFFGSLPSEQQSAIHAENADALVSLILETIVHQDSMPVRKQNSSRLAAFFNDEQYASVDDMLYVYTLLQSVIEHCYRDVRAGWRMDEFLGLIGRLLAHDNLHALRKKGLEVLLLLLEVMRGKLQEGGAEGEGAAGDAEAPASPGNSSSTMSGAGAARASGSPATALRNTRSPSYTLFKASREGLREREPEYERLPMHHRHPSVKKLIDMLAHTLELEQHYKADGATPGAATATGAARTKACCEPRLCVWSSELTSLKPLSLSQGLRTPSSVDEESELIQHFLDFVQRGASVADGTSHGELTGRGSLNPLNSLAHRREMVAQRLQFWLGVSVDVLLAKVYMPVCQMEGLLSASRSSVQSAGGDRRCPPLLQPIVSRWLLGLCHEDAIAPVLLKCSSAVSLCLESLRQSLRLPLSLHPTAKWAVGEYSTWVDGTISPVVAESDPQGFVRTVITHLMPLFTSYSRLSHESPDEKEQRDLSAGIRSQPVRSSSGDANRSSLSNAPSAGSVSHLLGLASGVVPAVPPTPVEARAWRGIRFEALGVMQRIAAEQVVRLERPTMRFLVLALRDSVAFLSCSVAETQASGRGRAMQYSRRTRRESTVPVFPEFADRGLSGPGTHLKSATTSGPDPEAAARAEGSAGAASSPSSGATPRGGAAEQGAGAGASGSASGAASTPSSAAGEAGVQHRASSGGVFLADSASVRGCRPLPALFNSLTAYFVPCAWAAYGSAEEARSTGVPLLTDGPVSIYLQLCLGSAALDPGSEALEGAMQSVAHNMGRPSLPGVGGDEDAEGAVGGEEGEEEAGGRSGRHDARHTAATAHRGRPTHKGAGAATDVVAALSSQYQKDVLLPVFALMLQVMVRAREQEKAVWALLYAVAPHCLRVAEVASHWRSVMVLMSALLHEGLDAASPSPSPASSSASLTRERVPSGSTTSRVERLRRVQAKYSARSACKRGLDVASLAGEDSDETSSRVDSGNSGSFSTSPRQSVTGDKDSAARTGSARAAAAPKGGAVSLEYQCMGLTPQELLVLWDRVAHFAGGGAPHRVHAVVRSASAHREVMLAFEDVMDVLSGCADVAPAKAAAGKRVRSTWSSDRVGVADLRSHAHARYASAELGATTTPALRVVSLEDGAGATNRSSAGGPNTLLAMVGQWLFPAAELPHGTFEVGASVAARALCRLFTRDGSGSIRGPYLARFAAMLHLALTFNNPRAHARAEEEAEEAAKAGGSSLFGAMQKTAAKGGEEEKKAHPAYSLRTWTVLHYSTDLFSRGLRGVGALLPHFLVAIELALADSYRPKLPPALRKAACRLLMRVVCLPQHLRTLPLLTTAHFTGDAFTGRVSGVQGAAAPGEDASSAMRVFQTVQGIVRDSSKGGGAAGEEGSGGGSASAQQPVGTLLLLPFMHALLLRLVETETEPALLAEHLRALTVTAVEVLNHEARQGGVGLAFEASSLLPEAAGSQRGGGSGADHSGEERAVEEALTLQDVLRDPALMHQFRRFCESEFSAENFLFWCEIEEFKRACAASHAQRVEADAEADPEALTPALERVAKRIFNRYVASSAVMMVNLPSSCAREIKVAMTRGNVRASVFDRAQGEIHFLMEKDTLRRFLNVLRSARQRIPAATVGALGGHAAAANPEISVAAIESLRSLCEFAPQLVSASPELPREIVLVLAHCVESASQAMHKQAPSPTAEAAEAGEGDQGHSAFSMLFGSNGTRAATPRHGAGIRRRLSTFVCEIPSAAVAVSAITTAVEWLLRGVRAPSGTEWDKQGQPCNLLDDSEVSAAVFGALQTALSECGALTSGRATGAGAGGDSSSTRGASLHSVAAAARTAIMQLLHRHNAFPGDTGPQQVCSLVTEEDALYRAMSHGAHASGAPVPPDGDAAGESGEKPARQVMGHVKGAVTSREQEVFCPFNTAPLVLAFHGRLLSLVEGECRDPAAALHQRGRRVLRVILRDAVGKHCWQYELPEAEARTGMESLWQQLVPKGGEGEQAGDAGWVSLQAHDVVPTPAGTEEPVLEPPSCPEAYSGSKAAQDDVSEAPTEERWRALVAGGAVEATASPSAEPADRSPAADEGQDSGEGAGVTAPAGTPIKWHRARRRMHGSVVQGTNHAVVPRLAPSSDRLSDLIHFLQREFALEVPPLSPPAELKGQAGTTLQRMCAACESQHDQEQRYAEARTGRMPGWRFHRESLPAPPGALTSRDLTRMLLSHLGLISEKGLRGMKRLSMAATSVAALKALDAAPARETTVCAVFYAPRVPGASSASQRAGAAIGRRHGPEEYRRLLQGLGWRVEAKQHGALGGHTAGVTVGHIVYHGTATTEAAFLDAPGLMREAEAEDAAGNTAVSGGAGGDESPKRASRSASKLSRLRAAPVHVVFCEGGVPEEDDYSPLGGPNTLVTLCIHPLPRFEDAGSAHTPKRAAAEPADRDHLYRVRIHTRSPGGGTRGVSHFGPLLDGMTVSRALLGPLIRETATNAHRAATLRYNQPFHVARQLAIDEMSRKYAANISEVELVRFLLPEDKQ